MIRAFRVGRRLARPARLGTLAKQGGQRGSWGLRPGACGAPSLLHTRCAAPQTTESTREQLPAALGTDGSKDSVAKVWSFEERPPVLRLCGAAAESSARKKKEYGSECDSSSSHSCRHLFSSRSC